MLHYDALALDSFDGTSHTSRVTELNSVTRRTIEFATIYRREVLLTLELEQFELRYNEDLAAVDCCNSNFSS